jgi:4-amino-4-deoxy-L-arabinose transferase-like glycosyltransferase
LGLAIAGAGQLAAAAGAWPGWLRALGFALTPLLIIGGLAFVIDSGVLTAVLTASLLVLLAWVAAVSLVSLRRHPQAKRVPK